MSVEAYEGERIWEWCEKTSDFIHEAQSLRELYEAKHSIEVEIRRRTFTPDGYVYVLRAGDYYKIGRAKDADSRIRQLKIQLPFPVEVAYLFPCEDYVATEAFYHRLYADVRVNGEWFLLGQQLASFEIMKDRDGILYREGEDFGPLPVKTGKLEGEV